MISPQASPPEAIRGTQPQSPGAQPLRLPRAPGRAWTGRTRGGYAGNWIFIQVLRFLGLRAASLLLVPVALYFVFFAPGALKTSIDYLRRRFKCGLPLCLVNSYRHFFCFGQVLLDRIAITANPGRFKVEEEGLSHILDSISAGKGLVLLSAHAGGWETALSVLGKNQTPVNVVMFEGEAEKIRELMEKSARKDNIRILGVSGAPEDSLAIVAALNRGEVVAMHGDRTLGGRTIRLPFLGAPADFPLWPYAVAAAAGSPIIYTFAARTGLYRYRLKAWPAVNPRLERRETELEPLRRHALDFVSRLEQFLGEYPFQWFNFYPFWK